MQLQVSRLRRWFAWTAVLFSAVVAVMYFYAHLRQRNVLEEVPNKIAYDIKQTASGFQFSKSEGGRTLFTIQANAIKEFKLNGRAELHHVSIVLYGRNSSRYDQIYGDDFLYDPTTGDITAKGEVQMDLEANPGGKIGPDQASPKELKNAIHLKTQDMIFNRDTGNASTAARVDFRTAQANGWAVGIQYEGRSNTLTLSSQMHIYLSGANGSVIYANHGVVTGQPRHIVLNSPVIERDDGTAVANEATIFLAADNSVDRIFATGNVHGHTHVQGKQRPAAKDRAAGSPAGEESSANQGESAPGPGSDMYARSDQADLLFASDNNQLRTAILTGNVQADRIGLQNMRGTAGRVILEYSGKNELQKVHARENVRLTQHAPRKKPSTTNGGTGTQDYELTAPVVDFLVTAGRFLERADTSGDAKITIFPVVEASPTAAASVTSGSSASNSPAGPASQRTVVTAGKFTAKFKKTLEGGTTLSTIHGAPNAKVDDISPGIPDRVSTSRTLDADFLSQGGIASLVQQGNVAYTDNQPASKRTQAWGDRGRYTPADQLIVLTGSPRVIDGATATTAKTIRINRATGQAFADTEVKSTYSELSEQPNGALLASSSPIHVTAQNMTAHNKPGVALYTGNARLWQDANVIEAPSIEFDRERRSVVAQGTPAQTVSTLLIQGSKAQDEKKPPEPQKTAASDPQKNEKFTPVAITSNRLTYADEERKAHYEGGVVARGSGFTATGSTMDVYLLPRSQTSKNKGLTGPGQLDHIVGKGDVVVRQTTRRAVGQQLVYTAKDDKFVLTEGTPSIFDAERGTITGVSLTFYRSDDRVLVNGEPNSPVLTKTRVAR